ncbi:uncharacterized protein LOC134442162 [Engraulis encrasicolus]|uniref:uncharacterized protein LOC134442162 n=1 Tax=Engraulis encrasicolus TaxID=184585 RepID=UPI002FD034D2
MAIAFTLDPGPEGPHRPGRVNAEDGPSLGHEEYLPISQECEDDQYARYAVVVTGSQSFPLHFFHPYPFHLPVYATPPRSFPEVHHEGPVTLNSQREELAISRDEVDISREEVDISREEVDVSREEVDVSREDVDVSREEVDVSREEVDVSREDVDVLREAFKGSMGVLAAALPTHTTSITNGVESLEPSVEDGQASGISHLVTSPREEDEGGRQARRQQEAKKKRKNRRRKRH